MCHATNLLNCLIFVETDAFCFHLNWSNCFLLGDLNGIRVIYKFIQILCQSASIFKCFSQNSIEINSIHFLITIFTIIDFLFDWIFFKCVEIRLKQKNRSKNQFFKMSCIDFYVDFIDSIWILFHKTYLKYSTKKQMNQRNHINQLAFVLCTI